MKKIYTEMRGGQPYTYGGNKYLKPGDLFYRTLGPYSESDDDGSLLSDLPKDKYDEALSVLKKWFTKSDRTVRRHTSYGYKHWLESEIRHYVSNNQLKDAMLILGFEPSDYDELNWQFKVKPTPVLKSWLSKRSKRW